jgi:hypothetical protein
MRVINSCPPSPPPSQGLLVSINAWSFSDQSTIVTEISSGLLSVQITRCRKTFSTGAQRNACIVVQTVLYTSICQQVGRDPLMAEPGNPLRTKRGLEYSN